jgi:hypothetical protein
MTDPTTPVNEAPATPADTGRRGYELFSLAALLILLVVLMERDYHLWALVPCLVGLGGIAGRWSLAVPMLLIALSFVLLDLGPVRSYRGPSSRSEPLSDLLLCAAVLGYAAAQYRLQGYARQMVPTDSRVRRTKGQAEAQCRRALCDGELPLLLLALPFFAWLATTARSYWFALAGWVQAKAAHVTAELPPAVWPLLVLLWVLGLTLLLWQLLAAFGTWRQRGRTPEEAVLFLQDLFWRETRGDQRRLFRWLTWTRLWNERRKERA